MYDAHRGRVQSVVSLWGSFLGVTLIKAVLEPEFITFA